MILRDYQQRDYDRIRSAFRKHRRVCYQAPTGSGKTVLFSATWPGTPPTTGPRTFCSTASQHATVYHTTYKES